jgi:hypothetical protein
MVAPAVETSIETVNIATTMHLWLAPAGTPLPTAHPASVTAYATDNLLNAAFRDVGYTDNDGATIKLTREITKHYAHQNSDPIIAVETKREIEIDAGLLEAKAANLIDLYGGTATSVTGGMKYEPAAQGSDIVYGVAVADFLFADKVERWVLKKCFPTGSGDIAKKKTDLSILPLTLVGLAPSASAGAWAFYSNEDVS